MAVTSIQPLRSTTGSHGVITDTYGVLFRVYTNSIYDSSLVVLSKFPVGAPLASYLGTATETFAPNQPPNCYTHPWPKEKCDGTAFTGAVDGQIHAILSSANIVDREKTDATDNTWIVEATFTLDKFTGPLAPVEIIPYFLYEDEPQRYAYWWGYRRRINNSSTDDCSTQPGKWGKPLVGGDGELGGKLTKENHLSTKQYRKTVLPVNSAGMPLSEPLTQRVGKPAYRVSWFSYTMLDFSCAIGRVNSNEYRLRSYNKGPQSIYETHSHANPRENFCKKFCPRELLISDVSCDIIRWGGRNGYRYTVELIHDPQNYHFHYVLDSGFMQLAETGDESAQGSKYSSDDTGKGSKVDVQTTVGNDGLAVQDEVLLNGRGKKLDEQDPANAFYHKYDVYEEIQFPDYKEITPDSQKHKWDRESKFPFLMDGGYRYEKAASEAPWKCDLTTIECTDPY
jgi:hypothetical protein